MQNRLGQHHFTALKSFEALAPRQFWFLAVTIEAKENPTFYVFATVRINTYPKQGTLTEGEGSVQLTYSLR
jgi:hypothetical protein